MWYNVTIKGHSPNESEKEKMKVFRRLPTEEEIKAAKFNKSIEIIQSICHVAAILFFFVGFYLMIYSACLVEIGEFSSAFLESSKGVVYVLVCFVLSIM